MKLFSKNITVRWMAVVAWLGVIYFFSAQPNLKSGFDTPIDLVLRKIAHMAEYFVLAFFVFRAWTPTWTQSRCIILTMIFCIAAAVLDEWHQLFVIGRSGNSMDVLVDCVGVVTYLGLHYYTSYANLRRN